MPAFIKAIQMVLKDLEGMLFYVDDILIFSPDYESQAGFTLNVQKYNWMQK